MAIKLLALDLDDTLLDKSSTVSPRCREAIKKAVEKGVTVTVATGRMYCSALPFARQLEIDVPIITYNGALIKSAFSGETLFQQTLDPVVASEVLNLFREQGWYIQVYVGDQLYVDEINDKARIYENLAKVKAIPVGQELYSMSDGVLKMLAMADKDEMAVIGKVVQQAFEGRVFAPISRPTYLEIVHPSINKGISLDFLANKLGITRNEVMAIGDSNNDLDMIQYAGLGVAMGNALPNVKAAADAVTLGNDEDGVAEAIYKYILNV
ncbi:Cof-type HAD-IIB family hydrolase [Dendrosporobacter sp. 1207_IL3150]|uniref:Cof-type HAD-IIB family hydrolase n=1 Tax=Dendrosporobacter sp. 1207_IL3150 TaxID=3084054 RepID=UPI002FD9ED22